MSHRKQLCLIVVLSFGIGHVRQVWCRFETEAEAPRVQRPWWKVVGGRRGGRQRDRRHDGLCCGRSASFGQPFLCVCPG